MVDWLFFAEVLTGQRSATPETLDYMGPNTNEHVVSTKREKARPTRGVGGEGGWGVQDTLFTSTALQEVEGAGNPERSPIR